MHPAVDHQLGCLESRAGPHLSLADLPDRMLSISDTFLKVPVTAPEVCNKPVQARVCPKSRPRHAVLPRQQPGLPINLRRRGSRGRVGLVQHHGGVSGTGSPSSSALSGKESPLKLFQDASSSCFEKMYAQQLWHAPLIMGLQGGNF